MLSIITPCTRPTNLPKLFESIHFDKIDKWIIVYDTSNKRKYDKLYSNHPQIIECECDNGISGNPQRNVGIDIIDDGFVYFLDDDNIIHPNFWSICENLDSKYFYTFNQLRSKNGDLLNGNIIKVCHIDTAMFIVHKHHINEIRWKINEYIADGFFICDILENNKDLHKYINKVGCYYNYLL